MTDPLSRSADERLPNLSVRCWAARYESRNAKIRRAQFFKTAEYNFAAVTHRGVANRDYNGVAFPRNPPRNKTATVELARRLFLWRGFLLPGKMTAGLPTFCLASDAQIEVAIIYLVVTLCSYCVFVFFRGRQTRHILECCLILIRE